jgi:hypothetical protein
MRDGGLSMSWFGKKPPDPDAIRSELFAAFARNDSVAFTQLLEAHEALILKHAIGWAKVPDAYRDPRKLDWYAQGLFTLAHQLAHRGRRELLDHCAPKRENLLVDWEDALRRIGWFCRTVLHRCIVDIFAVENDASMQDRPKAPARKRRPKPAWCWECKSPTGKE